MFKSRRKKPVDRPTEAPPVPPSEALPVPEVLPVPIDGELTFNIAVYGHPDGIVRLVLEAETHDVVPRVGEPVRFHVSQVVRENVETL